MVFKNPKYIFLNHIDFNNCREEIAPALNNFNDRWCNREHVELDTFIEREFNIFNLIDKRIKIYFQSNNLFRHLKQSIQELHRKLVLAPTDKAANNVVIV